MRSKTSHWKCEAIVALMISAISIPISAQAQDRVGVTVAAGGIFGTDPYPAEAFSEPLFLSSIQRVMKEHFVLEGDLSFWAHASRFDYGPQDRSHTVTTLGGVRFSLR